MSDLTIHDARTLLAHPVFGDEQHIEALNLMVFLVEVVQIRKEAGLIGIPCPRCGGDGIVRCGECGSSVDCQKCRGRGTVQEHSPMAYRWYTRQRLESLRAEAIKKIAGVIN
jgi:hypothetical protein